MFIHRVAMVVVELDQAGDPGELRNVRGQDAKLVHLPERLGDAVGRAEDGQKETQGAVRAAKRVVDEVQVAANRLFRLSAQLVPHLLAIPEDLQQPDRVDPEAFPLGGEDVDLPVELHEVVPDIPSPQFLHHGLHGGAGPLGAPLGDPPGELVEPPGSEIILLHELLDPVLRTVAESETGRHRDLDRQAQHVVLAGLEVVQLAPDAQEKVQRLDALAQFHGGEQVEGGQVRQVRHAMARPGDPDGDMEVPKPAGPFFDVGLLQVDRPAVFLVAPPLLLQFLRDVLLGPATLQAPPHAFLHLGEHGGLSGEEAGFQHGGSSGQIRLHHARGVGQRAAAVPDREAEIPETVQHVVQDRAHVLVEVPGIQKHHVHVGGGIQFAPTVPAQRHDRAALGLIPHALAEARVGEPEQLTDDRIHQVGMQGHHIETAGALAVRGLDAASLLADEPFDRGQQRLPERFSLRPRRRVGLHEAPQALRHRRIGAVRDSRRSGDRSPVKQPGQRTDEVSHAVTCRRRVRQWARAAARSGLSP